MLPTAQERETQATELLRLASLPGTRAALLTFGTQLTGSEEAGMNLYQQALLDTHDTVQVRGAVIQDVRFYLLKVMRNSHVDEQRRLNGLRSLPASAEQLPDGEPPTDGAAHLAGQVAAFVHEEFEPADRVLMNLNAEGYSSRQIETLTGRPWRTVARRLKEMKEQVRATFAQSWQGL